MQYVNTVPLLALLAFATLTDLRERRIPNGLVFGGALVAVLIQWSVAGPAGVGLAAVGWLVCLLCFAPFYASGAMAAGDVKLMAMVGAFLGPVDGFFAVVCTLLVGALIGSGALLIKRLRSRQPVVLAGAESQGAHDAAIAAGDDSEQLGKIPYAAAIAAGAVLVVTQRAWLPSILSGVL